MEEDYKNLAVEIANLLVRLRRVDIGRFLEFIRENYSDELAIRVEAMASTAFPREKKIVPKTEGKLRSEWEIYAPEIRAVLSDLTFLPTDEDLVSFLSTVLGVGRLRLLPRSDGREKIIDWALHKIGKLRPRERQLIYRNMRQMFLRRRDSSLSDWADILSKPRR